MDVATLGVRAQSVTSAPASTPTPTACTSSTPGCPGYNPAKDPDCQVCAVAALGLDLIDRRVMLMWASRETVLR